MPVRDGAKKPLLGVIDDGTKTVRFVVSTLNNQCGESFHENVCQMNLLQDGSPSRCVCVKRKET